MACRILLNSLILANVSNCGVKEYLHKPERVLPNRFSWGQVIMKYRESTKVV